MVTNSIESKDFALITVSAVLVIKVGAKKIGSVIFKKGIYADNQFFINLFSVFS